MNKWNYVVMAMGTALALSACSDDVDVNGNNGVNAGGTAEQVFMQFSLELPTVSRSVTTSDEDDKYVTSEDGVEIGQDNENAIKSVMVVIKGNDFTAKSSVESDITSSGDTYVVPFKTAELTAHAGENVNVYVYCNPGDYLSAEGATFSVDDVFTLSNDGEDVAPWSKTNGFLMTNAVQHQATLPSEDDMLHTYNTVNHSFGLGTIQVERAAARFDYKSGAGNDIYTLMEENGNPTVQIKLTEMALVNLSKNFYYLRRVSADGTATGATVSGVETKTNYVVDTDAPWKSSYSNTTSDEASHFLYVYNPNDASTTDYKWTSISFLTTEDKDDSWNSGTSASTDKNGYKIWRYATENTIPKGINNELQKKGITTGVVFKGEIFAPDNSSMKAKLNGTNTVYVYDNIMYGTWDDVKTAANAAPNTPLEVAYQAVEAATADKEKVAATNGFTVFAPNNATEKKYEVLYYYWNRHNDNNNDGLMGPMEFGVVRNNVYKLSVTDVHKFGHPTNPDHDPDPEDPEDPDEDSNVYFNVAVQVLPWVVRVNDIEF